MALYLAMWLCLRIHGRAGADHQKPGSFTGRAPRQLRAWTRYLNNR